MPCRFDANKHLNINAVIFFSSLLLLLIIFLLFSILALLSLTIYAIYSIRLLFLIIFCLILLGFLLLLLLSVLELVLDQIMESGDSSNQTAKVDGHQLIVCLDAHGM